nr:hypothetical protein [Bacteroides sp.]
MNLPMDKWYEAMKPLSAADRGAVIGAIMDYVYAGIEEPELSPALMALFCLMRTEVDDILARRHAAAERRNPGAMDIDLTDDVVRVNLEIGMMGDYRSRVDRDDLGGCVVTDRRYDTQWRVDHMVPYPPGPEAWWNPRKCIWITPPGRLKL